jgi:hypothetical protein
MKNIALDGTSQHPAAPGKAGRHPPKPIRHSGVGPGTLRPQLPAAQMPAPMAIMRAQNPRGMGPVELKYPAKSNRNQPKATRQPIRYSTRPNRPDAKFPPIIWPLVVGAYRPTPSAGQMGVASS